MLRRLFDGLVLIVLVLIVIARLDAGEVVLGLGLAANSDALEDACRTDCTLATCGHPMTRRSNACRGHLLL